MGFFSSRPSLEDQSSRQYLEVAPPGPRTDLLAASCILRTSELPVASADQFGQVVTVAVLAPVSDLVRRIMFQDRDLSAWIVRKSVSYLQWIAENAMSGPFDSNFDVALSSVGLRAPAGLGVHVLDESVQLTDVHREAAISLADLALSVLRALVFSRPDERGSSDWRFYSRLYTGQGIDDVEGLGYDIIAWTSIVVARLLTAGRIVGAVPVFAPEYRAVQAMDTPGWYPNPPKYGGVVSGDAVFQRFWDGKDWTDQVRTRNGRGWEIGTLSLHQEPID